MQQTSSWRLKRTECFEPKYERIDAWPDDAAKWAKWDFDSRFDGFAQKKIRSSNAAAIFKHRSWPQRAAQRAASNTHWKLTWKRRESQQTSSDNPSEQPQCTISQRPRPAATPINPRLKVSPDLKRNSSRRCNSWTESLCKQQIASNERTTWKTKKIMFQNAPSSPGGTSASTNCPVISASVGFAGEFL